MTNTTENDSADANQSASDVLGRKAAHVLLDMGAVLFRPERPFFFSSGWASPVYVNCKNLLSFPDARNELIALSLQRIESVLEPGQFDGIAGAGGAGVPFASIIADRLNLPLVVARKQAAGIGPRAQIDGEFVEGARLLLVDDVTTDGETKASMGAALRKAGASVQHVFVVFQYGIFDAVLNNDDLGIQLLSLLTWQELLQQARERQDFSDAVIAQIEDYVRDPLLWSSRHGGISEQHFRRTQS